MSPEPLPARRSEPNSMRVIHAIGGYLPETVGGTEIYLKGLSGELNARGVDSRILAGSSTPGRDDNDQRLDRYPVVAASTRDQIRGDRPHDGFEDFAAKLAGSGADVYHQHGWSYRCGLHHLKYARELGLPTVLTLHLPGNLCLRGTMMRNGRTVCDGRIDEHTCGVCWLRSKGMPAPAAQVFSRLPRWLSRYCADHSLSRIGTVLATRTLVERHRVLFRDTVAGADRLVSVCHWLDEAVRRNGVDDEKLLVCRHGVDRSFVAATRRRRRAAGAPLIIAYVGRADPVKGVDTLICALRGAPDVPVRLLVRASCSSAAEHAHLEELKNAAAGDPRIEFGGAVAHHDLAAFLAGADVLAVPSVWLETGPLVVREAQACGLPVLGSDLGGIAELVRDEVDGLLLPPGRPDAWRMAILRLSADPGLLTRLANGVSSARTMADVASEMHDLYASLAGLAPAAGVGEPPAASRIGNQDR